MTASSEYEITTDGRTVWVNGPTCLGRMCPVSAEVFDAQSHPLVQIVTGKKTPSTKAWCWWVETMLAEHDIAIPDTYKPTWCQDESTLDQP